MNLDIPGFGKLEINTLVLDYNGTIASSGKPLDIHEDLESLSQAFDIYILTGNTFGDVASQFNHEHVSLILTKTADDKLKTIKTLNPSTCIAIGNGAIDHKMLKVAAIGIAVIGDEGCSTKAIEASDIVVNSINDAISLVVNPLKLVAVLKE